MTQRIGPWIHEGQQAFQTISRMQHKRHQAGKAAETQKDNMRPPQSRHEQHDRHHGPEHHQGTEIGLHQQQPPRRTEHCCRQGQSHRRQVRLGGITLQVCGHEDHHQQARQLGNLDHHRSQDQPAAAAIDGFTQPGHQDDTEQQQGQHGTPWRKHAEPTHGCRPDRHGQGQPHGQKGHLATQEIGGVPGPGQRRIVGGRKGHDETDSHQGASDGQQQAIETHRCLGADTYADSACTHVSNTSPLCE